MPTFLQLIKKIRKKPKKLVWAPKLFKCPQKKGICLKVFWVSPKKPNSANRRVTKVLLSNTYKIDAHVPGIGHNLQKHSAVLIRGGRVRDIPGMKYRTIREKYSLSGLYHRKKGRSKYGSKAK